MRLVGERKAGDMTHSAAAMKISTSAGPAPERTLRKSALERLTAVWVSVMDGLGGFTVALVGGGGEVHDPFLGGFLA